MVQKQKMIRKKSKQLTKLKQATSTDNNLNVSLNYIYVILKPIS